MIQENKDLLLKDLCARLPYGVKVQFSLPNYNTNCFDDEIGEVFEIGDLFTHVHCKGIDYLPNTNRIKPYLRSMSSMTEEECITLSKLIPYETNVWKYIKTPIPLYIANIEQFDFFHSHHLDWRGLIQKGLALEAPKNMYSNE